MSKDDRVIITIHPIEYAPKDGTKVLLINLGDLGTFEWAAVGVWDRIGLNWMVWVPRLAEYGEYEEEWQRLKTKPALGTLRKNAYPPTHYMVLPEKKLKEEQVKSSNLIIDPEHKEKPIEPTTGALERLLDRIIFLEKKVLALEGKAKKARSDLMSISMQNDGR